jgi:hypothetical protein
MKIVLCLDCREVIVPFVGFTARCFPDCEHSFAELRPDDRTLELRGPCVGIGLGNDSLAKAIEARQHGNRNQALNFKAWIIPEPSQWILRVERFTSEVEAARLRNEKRRARGARFR